MFIPGVNKRDFAPRSLPTDGPCQMVLCDVVDLGYEKETFDNVTKDVLKVRLLFQVDEMDDTQDPPVRHTVGRKFTASYHEKSKLYAFLLGWKVLPTEEQRAAGYDLDALIGTNGNGVIDYINPDKADPTIKKATVSLAMQPIGRSQPKLKVENYVRVKDRPKRQVVGGK